MRLAVGADDAGAVHGENDGQAVQRHVLDHLVIAALQKARIHRHDGAQALLGHAGGHRDGVSLRDSDVKEALRQTLRKAAEARAVRHRGGDRGDRAVFLREGRQRLAEDGGKVRALLPGNALCRVEGPDAVIGGGVGLRGRVALALDGQHVQQHRAVHLAGVADRAGQGADVMSVDGAEVIKAHVFKHIIGQKAVLDPFLDAVQHAVDGFIAPDAVMIGFFQRDIARLDAQIGQQPRQTAHVLSDAHRVVVEDDDDGLPARAAVGEALIGKAAGQSSVADKGADRVILAAQRPRPGHAQRAGDRGGGVAGDAGVVGRLAGLREAGKSAYLPQGIKAVPPPGEELMGIALVPDVEDDAVPAAVIDAVQRHRQLHGAQIGRQMPAGFRNVLYQFFPQLGAQQRKLLLRQRLDVRGRMDLIQYFQFR